MAAAVEAQESGDIEKEMNNTTSPMLWSKGLATPDSGDRFSPSRDMEDKDNLHGVGLQKALDHGKMVSRSGRRCALMLLEGASCYEQFGVALMKASQANPLEGEASKSISSLCQQTRQLATTLREEIAAPLQSYHTTIGETFPSIHQKYTYCRQRAYGARQRALLARTKYLKAVKDAEQACSTVMKTVKTAESEGAAASGEEKKINIPESAEYTKADWEKSLEDYGKLKGPGAVDQVTHLLNAVKSLQRRYECLVEKENNAVTLAQNMEAVALEGIQKLEEQRLCMFYNAIVRSFEEIKVSLDNLVISAEIEFDESSKEHVKVVQKKGDFFSTILKVGNTQGEKTGVADAETLGLDEDVGKLRDEMQSRLASRLARHKKVKALAALFVNVSVAAEKLGKGLLLIVQHEDSYVSSKGTPVEHLRTLMSSCEGPRTLDLWSSLMKTFQNESDAFQQFSRVLASVKESKLDQNLLMSEKDIKDLAEQDDARWKQLCDAARTEMRAETKYRQSTAQTVKARERMGSVDKKTARERLGSADNKAEAEANKATKSPQKPQNQAKDKMNKAFGNFLSLLPDGGEQAMQILSPDARRAVAEKQVAEADGKELKVKQAYDNAIALKNRVVESYRSNSQPLVKKYELEELSGIDDIKAGMISLLDFLKTLQTSRYETLAPLSELGDQPLKSALEDLNDWVHKAIKTIEAEKKRSRPSEDTAVAGFKLPVTLCDSEDAKQVLQFARIGNCDSFESDDGSERGEKDSAIETLGPVVRVSTEQDSNRSLDLNSVKAGEGEEVDETADSGQQTKKWLQKSFSAPIGKQSGFKKLRKFHSGITENEKYQAENAEVDARDDVTESSTISTTIPPQNRQESLETELFSRFWPDFEGTAPGVTGSFSCAFLPKDCSMRSMGSVEHGRLFLTHRAAVFIAWRGKKAVVSFPLMTKVQKTANLFGVADDTLLLSAQSKGTQPSLLLSCFSHRDQALEIIQNRIEKENKTRTEAEKMKKETSVGGMTAEKQAAPVAPDAVMGKMETVLSKKIRGVPINKFHEIVWMDKTSEETFYGGWLGQGGKCKDLKVAEWETSDAGFTGAWCGEKYTHKRELTFQLIRNSMIGPPVAGVKQTQYCRMDGPDRSIMMMTVAFDGIPYSDSFTVEVRWVATRGGTKDITIQVGVFVMFHKSTLLKSQIRNGTLSETKPVHKSLFKVVKEALSKEEDDGAGEDEGIEEESTLENAPDNKDGVISMVLDGVMENLHIAGPVLAILFLLFVRWVFSSSSAPVAVGGNAEKISSLNGKIDDLQTEMKLMRQSIEHLTKLFKDQMDHNNLVADAN